MLGDILRFIFIVIGVVLIVYIFPALVIFFVQVLIAAFVFLGILYIISLFYKGDGDER